jgi:uncharacterized damage-inducible protein DinB
MKCVTTIYRKIAMLSKNARIEFIDRIRNLPQRLIQEVSSLSNEQLDTPYRDNGWTVRQVVHHLADSHYNAMTRFKLIFTEDCPTLGVYDQDLWTEMVDAKEMDIENSLLLLTALHKRMVYMLESFTNEIFCKEGKHPEFGIITIDDLLFTYADHGDKHLAQITSLKTKQGWQ